MFHFRMPFYGQGLKVDKVLNPIFVLSHQSLEVGNLNYDFLCFLSEQKTKKGPLKMNTFEILSDARPSGLKIQN